MSSRLSRRTVLQGGAVLGAVAWLAPLLAACSNGSEKRLVFLNWQDYIDPTILTDFTGRTGLPVTYETYASNDELARRLRLASVGRRRGREGSSFDLIVPSDNLLRRLHEADMLQTLDTSAVTNLDNLDPAFRKEPFDPGNRFSVPWATGTTGIGYDSRVFSAAPDWTVFLDQTYAGKMTILDEMRDAFALALFSQGQDPNTRDPGAIDAAADQLIAMEQAGAAFDSATYLDRLANGDLTVAHAYSTDLLQARERNPNLAYVVPEQGGLRWIDSLCIPDGAPDPDAANRFANYYLEPEVSATNAVANKVDTGNAAAREFIPQEILEDPAVFPPQDVLARLVFTEDLGEDEKLYEEAWGRVKTAS